MAIGDQSALFGHLDFFGHFILFDSDVRLVAATAGFCEAMGIPEDESSIGQPIPEILGQAWDYSAFASPEHVEQLKKRSFLSDVVVPVCNEQVMASLIVWVCNARDCSMRRHVLAAIKLNDNLYSATLLPIEDPSNEYWVRYVNGKWEDHRGVFWTEDELALLDFAFTGMPEKYVAGQLGMTIGKYRYELAKLVQRTGVNSLNEMRQTAWFDISEQHMPSLKMALPIDGARWDWGSMAQENRRRPERYQWVTELMTDPTAVPSTLPSSPETEAE